jgi:enediyne biosynthesis protein E4
MRNFCSILLLVFFLAACNTKQQRFTRISPEQSGIQFANNITESDSLNIFTFEYIYNGGGVGVGDLNNDGLEDIFFAGNMVTSKLYLNKGHLKFEDITAAAKLNTTTWCTGVAIIDINADGRLDIYLSTAFTNKKKPVPNLCYINKGINENGIPVFEEKAAAMGLADSAYCSQAAFFDYDLDGDLDMYLCTNSVKESDRNEIRGQRTDGGGESQDKLYRNDGINPGTKLPHFTNVSTAAGITTEGWGLGVIVKDINRDGWPDIYVANDFQSNDHLYINNKNGSFTNHIKDMLTHSSHNAMGVDIADFNNDGLEDICVVDMLPDDNLRQKTMFGAIPNDKYENALRRGYQPQFVRNTLQLNNGVLPGKNKLPGFSDIGYLAGIAATDWSWTPLWADLDLDGWKDLLITNGYVKDITDLDFASFSSESRMFGSAESRIKTLRKKMQSLGEVKKTNWLFHNEHNLIFADSSASWGFPEKSFSNGAAYADLDNDGDLDLVINNLNDPAFLYENNSRSAVNKTTTAPHYLNVRLQGSKENSAGIGATITLWQKGRLQYAEQCLQRGYLSTVSGTINFGLGNNPVIDSIIVRWPGGKKQILTQVPADTTLIIFAEKSSPAPAHPQPIVNLLFTPLADSIPFNYQHTENIFNDFDVQFTLPQKYSIQGPAIAVADVNGDGLEDFYVAGASRQSGSLFIQSNKGFTEKKLLAAGDKKTQEETGVLFLDADGDGDQDLYLVGGGNEFRDEASYQDLFFRNDGKGNFTADSSALPNTTGSGSCITAADIDQDGDLDIFVGGRNKPLSYPLSSRSYLLRNDSDPKTKRILFTDITATAAPGLLQPGMVTAGIFTDYNNDGFADILITGEFMPLQLFRNQQNGQFVRVEVAAFKKSAGWYNSLTRGDFDNDGDIDYIAGNLGLNSRYKASTTEPLTIRYNDYDKDKITDAFLYQFNKGIEYPVQTRTQVMEQIPLLKKKFFYFHAYGEATYTSLFSEKERMNDQILPAYQLASVYISNEGHDSFALKPLPIAAQTAPVQGMLPMDVNEDGWLDLLMVGNSYAPEALTGRYDASKGWVLLGAAKTQFVFAPPATTGFDVPGDARSLVYLQGKKGQLILASQNQGPLAIFNALTTTCIPLLPDDFGLIVELADGSHRKQEYYPGDGYLSQSGRQVPVPKNWKSIVLLSTGHQNRTIKPLPF